MSLSGETQELGKGYFRWDVKNKQEFRRQQGGRAPVEHEIGERLACKRQGWELTWVCLQPLHAQESRDG